MRLILEWLKPGAKIKRYLFLQLVSIAVTVISVYRLVSVLDMDFKHLITYIILITVSAFGIIYSFIVAQRNILLLSLKNISKKSHNINLKKLLYEDISLKKGPKVVIIGGGSGLSNILRGLKEYTSNITTIVTPFDEDEDKEKLLSKMDKMSPGDVRKIVSALSTSEETIEKLLTYKLDGQNSESHSLGNQFMVAMTEIEGSFAGALEKVADIFTIRGKILPITLDKMKLCAGLENGEVVVGQENLQTRIKETKSPVKQIFLKEGNCKPAPNVIESIKDANIIVLGPGSLYTSVACNLLVDGVAKAIIQSKAKKVFISNIMNQPGQTDGYTLARHVNEIERYIGKHVLDYCIANNGEITEEMLKDFNQGISNPLRNDLENIQNRAISVIEDDLVITAPNAILHDSDKVAGLVIQIAKSKKIGDLNIVKIKKKHMRNEKKLMSNRRSIKEIIAPLIEILKKKVDIQVTSIKKKKEETVKKDAQTEKHSEKVKKIISKTSKESKNIISNKNKGKV